MDYFSILVVDDEVDFLETLVKRLQKAQHRYGWGHQRRRKRWRLW
jgi:CheY-like chemotaxis protein